jgi:hypothetical protein
VSLTLVDNNYTINFNVQTEIKGGYLYNSSTITIQLKCGPSSSIMSAKDQLSETFSFFQYEISGKMKF